MAKIPKCGRLSRPALWSTFGRTIVQLDFTFLIWEPRKDRVRRGGQLMPLKFGAEIRNCIWHSCRTSVKVMFNLIFDLDTPLLKNGSGASGA